MSLRLNLLLSAALLMGSGRSVIAAPAPHSSRCPKAEQVVVSWYGEQFDGRPTANGETFSRYALTAAHPSLPLGVRARFTNPSNGRSVEVRVNDRGPYEKDTVSGKYVPHSVRAYDLSEAAAIQLDIRELGTARVQVQLVCG